MHESYILNGHILCMITVAGKCKATLQGVKHFYKTFLHIIQQNYMSKTQKGHVQKKVINSVGTRAKDKISQPPVYQYK